jgi:hypothetical protein
MAVQRRGDSIKKLTPPPSSGEHHRCKNVRCKREHHRLSICCSDRPQARPSGRLIVRRLAHAEAVLSMRSRRTQRRKPASAKTHQGKQLRVPTNRPITTNIVVCPFSTSPSWAVLEVTFARVAMDQGNASQSRRSPAPCASGWGRPHLRPRSAAEIACLPARRCRVAARCDRP